MLLTATCRKEHYAVGDLCPENRAIMLGSITTGKDGGKYCWRAKHVRNIVVLLDLQLDLAFCLHFVAFLG